MRDVEARLKWYLSNRPGQGGMCAYYAMKSLDVAPQGGFPDATAMVRRVEADGHMHGGPAPKGAFHYWDKGSEGHGHVALAADHIGNVASVDVLGPNTVGVKPFPWFAANWPALRYRGWSWWFGGIDTQPKEMTAMAVIPPYIMLKVDTDQVIPLNTWVQLDLGTKDKIQPPIGADDFDAYVNLDFSTLKGAGRNDLRYILGRWARHDASSKDLTEMAGQKVDVTGADTKAIPPDLPERWFRSTWTHGFKGESGVPISFWVYIGSRKDGSVVSPLRIFKVDDET